jgi:cytochrome c biogenesis protein CcmG, thiol:disulfide interchange protein DsbE
VSPDESAPTPPRRGWDRRQKITAVVVAVVIIAIGATLTVGLTNNNVSNGIDGALAKGQRPAAPNFTLPVLTSAPGLPPVGQQVSLSQLRGHPVVLNIWASWCVPCTQEAPVLQSLWDHYRSKGVIVLGVDVKDLEGDAVAFHTKYGLTYPTVHDGAGSVQAAFGSTGVPENFVIDKQGRIAGDIRSELVASGSAANIQGFASAIDTVVAEPATTK